MTALYQAHSGIRYLVLLLAVAAAVVFLHGLLTRRAPGKADRVTMSIFTGVLDLQILLGIGLVIAGIFYGALMGHLMMMLLAAISVHAAAAIAKRKPENGRAHGIRLVGVVLALVLILGGIMAIGRAPFESNLPTQTS